MGSRTRHTRDFFLSRRGEKSGVAQRPIAGRSGGVPLCRLMVARGSGSCPKGASEPPFFVAKQASNEVKTAWIRAAFQLTEGVGAAARVTSLVVSAR